MIGWIGTIASIVGSFLVAFQIAVFGYILFLVGSISWLWVGYVKKERSLITLNLFFLVANLVGLYNYWS